MVTFGGFETVYELYRHGLGSVSRARAANGKAGEPEYVVKVFHPPHRITGHEALKPAVDSFLERARLQQDVATGGARYWAPVYEAGATRPGAYYVSRYYARSAQKLIASRVKLTSDSLYAVVHAVVQGLLELRHACSRGHGNLTPSNILIGGQGDLDQAPIVLTDPAPPEELARNGGGSEDLAGLGELIYQLVLHRPSRGLQSWPVPRSAEWARLGSRGEAWRELCNHLLDPNARQTARLDEVARRVEALRPRPWAITPARVAVLALLVVVALGALFAARYNRFKGEWREFCTVTDDWFYRFQADRERLHRLEQDPHLATVLKPVLAEGGPQLDPKRIAGNEMLVLSSLADQPPLSWQAMGKTRRALATIRSVEAGLTPEQWPLLHELAERQQDYQKRHWDPCAQYLARLIDDVTPRPKRDVGAGIVRLLDAQARLRADLGEVESRWQAVEAARTAIAEKAGDDKVLGQFAPFVDRSLAAVFAGGPDVREPADLVPPLTALAARARQLTEVLQSDWTNHIDRQRLAREAEVYSRTPSAPDDKYFQDWLADVQDYYRFKVDRDTEPAARMESLAAETRKEIDDLRRQIPDAADVAGKFDARLAALQKDVLAFEQTSWVTRDRREDVIGRRAVALQNGLKTLKDEVWIERSQRTFDQKQWWADANRQTIADSAAINDYWKAWRGKLPVDASRLPMDVRQFMSIQSRVDERRKLLSELDKTFPAAPTLEDPYAAIARRKREEMLAAILRTSPWLEEAPNVESLRQEQARRAAEYTDWCKDAPAFLKNVADARSLLDNAYDLAGAPGFQQIAEHWKSRPVWNDLSGEPGVAAVLQRLADLAAVGSMDPKQLVAKATAPDSRPEIVLAAWRRLVGLDSSPWPSGADELKAEAEIRNRLKDMVVRAPDAVRRQAITAEVRQRGPREMVRFLSAADGKPEQIEPALSAAGAAVDSFDVPAARNGPASPWVRLSHLEGLAPETRFNLLLYGLRQAATALPPPPDADKVARLTSEFRDEVRALPEAFRQRQQAVGDVLAGLDRLDQPEPQFGPSATWRQAPAPPGRLRFVPPGGEEAMQALEFVRVDPRTARPFFLCTTELSLAQFLAVIPPTDWVQGRGQLLSNYRRGDDPRPGPRVWQWGGAGGFNTSIEQTEYWLRERDTPQQYFEKRPFNNYALPPTMGVDAPGHPKLPMQYLPAPTALYVAARLGCRLPTSDEWNAAYALTPRDAAWNLRDQTWERQRQHVAASGGRLEWPDAGAFWPRGYKGPRRTGADAESQRTRDNNLWFREVDDGGGGPAVVFQNLVGNVAEFVWDDARGFEQVRDKSLASVYKLLEQQPDKLFVIGGSALSAPELDATRPLPVDLGRNDTPPSAWVGYADVGMRLAFSAPSTPVQRLLSMLREQSYLVRKQ